MAKIITVTANTAIDFFIEVDDLAQNNIQAAKSTEFACGKGVNVGKAITMLENPVVCLGFVGRQSLGAFNAINTAWLKTDFIAVDGNTRTNLTLFDTTTNREIHIRTPGFAVSAKDCQKLLAKVDATVESGDIVIFSGSLPAGAADNLYQVLVELCHSKAAVPLLDSSGKCLREGIKAKPYLIKPNQQELEELIGSNLADELAIVAAARSLIAQGVEWVCVSRGGAGIVMVGKQVAVSAYINILPGKILSQIGCGDALLAGLAVALFKELEFPDDLKLGLASGTANLFSIEPGRFDLSIFPEIIKETKICTLYY